ncbi:MAG: DUF1800 domain-containing protein [Alphaproteobacteria bacterium]|nr:DUF1800 domain-containing protein [Alphaproteobacteria bacterium]
MKLCRFVVIFLAFSAIAAVGPAARALDREDARHLLLRTGFGASPAEVQRLAPLGRAQAVDAVLASVRSQAVTPPPAFMADPHPDWPGQWRSKDEEQKSVFNRARDAEGATLRAWWWQELIRTPSPFTERMVLFWHNHFTSSMDKVRAPNYLFRQNALFRENALGSFRALLHAVAKDPAMVRYLDSLNNRKAGPNENFARELLELFTLGEGQYGEADIKAAARAFSGWHNDEREGVFKPNTRELDDGPKTFLRRTGGFTGGEIIDIVLEQPAVAVFMTRKLWREFVSDEPDEREVARLAAIFRNADYRIDALMRAMLTSPMFWDRRNRAALVKSPVELLVGTVRQVAPEFADMTVLVEYGRRMRQDLFNPPNVRGWPGGATWISTETLLVRREALARLASGIPADRALTPDAAQLLLATPPLLADAGAASGRAQIEALLFDPAYQVK